jgi:SAM-dependent methyltransferase
MKPIQSYDKSRTLEEIRAHYEIEIELANKLKSASKQDRHYLYSDLYNELFRRVPSHPQLISKTSPEDTARSVKWQMLLLKRFLTADATFMEIGPGDCALSYEVAKQVKQVYALDVSEEITKAAASPANFHLIISDGCSVPLPAQSINVAYSNQLMEHLHSDDASEQLQNIYNALIPGGCYICITPNRLTGPHDVSMYFDEVATGFHLKEYTVSELHDLFREVGFSRIQVYLGGSFYALRFSLILLRLSEQFLSVLPLSLRNTFAQSLPFLKLLNSIRIVGIK